MVCYRLYPFPPCAPCELLPSCPAAVNWARRLCSMAEDTRGKVTAGVANPGAGAGAGAGALGLVQGLKLVQGLVSC